MRFWDSSALVPLLVPEPSANEIAAVFRSDPDQTVWWTTEVECVSALARRERAGAAPPEEVEAALDLLRTLSGGWVEIAPAESVRRSARRLIRSHELRAADAFQLAAALEAVNDPTTLPVVTLDTRLALAARREGFPVLP